MTFAIRTTPCPECNDGHTYRPIRWSGEQFGEWVDERCDECAGTGLVEAGCASCEHIVPLDEHGFCACCADIPDEVGLTEVHGDPMLRKDAA